MVTIIRNSLMCLAASLFAQAFALELAIDAGYNGSTQVEDWGASTHLQLKGSKPYGIDLGYQYLNTINYDALGTTLNHSMSQYEASLFWQAGNKGFRLQTFAGGVLSNSWIQANGGDVIRQNSLGYQLGVGVSVPLFTRFRAFAESDYQGWLDAQVPSHVNWRYGLRIIFGGNDTQPLEAQEQAEQQAAEELAAALQANPPVTIDPAVPEYVPSPFSQSLPPIVANGEICKCYPAGPYSLQLGEFNSMAAATRGLEYRGLRQFFNSRAYLKSPLPVFLTQSEIGGPVSVYLGELSDVEQMQFWRHELRKSGLQAKYRKVVGANGQRIANPIVNADEAMASLTPKYTAEEIRRMNSLPEDWAKEEAQKAKAAEQLMNEKAQFETEQAQLQAQLNQMEPIDTTIDSVIQVGPLPMKALTDLFTSEAMRSVLARDPNIKTPQKMDLTWDEANTEAWLNFSNFADEQHLDEWLAWLGSEQIASVQMEQPYQPLGDIYYFELGGALAQFSLEVEREPEMAMMLRKMRSPEVLWFQAYQRINQQPLNMSLNWGATDQRYHLIVTNVTSKDQQQHLWANLTSVGLLPSLAEQ